MQPQLHRFPAMQRRTHRPFCYLRDHRHERKHPIGPPTLARNKTPYAQRSLDKNRIFLPHRIVDRDMHRHIPPRPVIPLQRKRRHQCIPLPCAQAAIPVISTSTYQLTRCNIPNTYPISSAGHLPVSRDAKRSASSRQPNTVPQSKSQAPPPTGAPPPRSTPAKTTHRPMRLRPLRKSPGAAPHTHAPAVRSKAAATPSPAPTDSAERSFTCRYASKNGPINHGHTAPL